MQKTKAENGYSMMILMLTDVLMEGSMVLCLGGEDTFRQTSGDILRALRNSEKAPGAERIYTAGEKEWLAWQERKDLGVPVGQTIQQELIQLRDELKLPYTFPFEK